MADKSTVLREIEGRPLFVEGYFSDRIWSGENPKYGYPTNHVPGTTFSSMVVQTGYISALKAAK
jgi:hypothetical protein